MTSNRLIKIKTFYNSVQAHILQTRLKSEGIESFIFDENVVSLNPMWSLMMGGIKLKVNEHNYLKAKDLLEGVENTKVTNEEGREIRCPIANQMR